MDEEENKKKMNDDLVVFMSKRSEHEVPRYTARLKTYVDIQQKHRRAAAARRHSEHGLKKSPCSRKKECDQKAITENSFPAGKEHCNKEHSTKEDEQMSKRNDVLAENIHHWDRHSCKLHTRSRMRCLRNGPSISRSDSRSPTDRYGRHRRRRRSRRRRRRRGRRRRRRRSRRRRRRSGRRRRRRRRRRSHRRRRR